MPGFHCTCCGQFHEELPMSLGSPAPAAWFEVPEGDRPTRTALSSDQCIIDNTHFFLLARLELPVVDASESFFWLIWVSVSEANFNRANDLWHTEGREGEPPYFVWVQSALPYPGGTLSLKGELRTQPVGQRPLVYLEPTEHQLSLEQREGITMARVQQIIEGALHGSDA
jgi:hypothetical protein